MVSTSTTSVCGPSSLLSIPLDLLSQQGIRYVSDGKPFHLHAWRLSCSTTKQQDLQKRSLDSRQLLEGPLQTECKAKNISDMITSVELQRPRITPVLPQWNLGIVLEALSKPPYELPKEASLKHLTLKTVFLLAMASDGRRS